MPFPMESVKTPNKKFYDVLTLVLQAKSTDEKVPGLFAFHRLHFPQFEIKCYFILKNKIRTESKNSNLA